MKEEAAAAKVEKKQAGNRTTTYYMATADVTSSTSFNEIGGQVRFSERFFSPCLLPARLPLPLLLLLLVAVIPFLLFICSLFDFWLADSR